MKPVVLSADLKYVLRQMKLSPMLDTLPERVVLARQSRMSYQDFLELVLADEIARRERVSARNRGRRARLDPAMTLEMWDDNAPVGFDRELWAELCTLRFMADAHDVVVMGPVGVGKTHLASALGHIAVRRKHRVLSGRADRMLKKLKAARLDQTYPLEFEKAVARRPPDHRRPGAAAARSDRDPGLLRDRRRAPPGIVDDRDLQPRAG